jgi:RNA polymerase sigma-70 factor, ECF subfamily
MAAAAPDKDLTAALQAYSSGEPRTVEHLLRLVYGRLHEMAEDQLRREGPGHTLQPTALVNEAYVRLAHQTMDWRSRAHFFAIAAQAMRRVLLDHARARRSEKRGGGRRPLPLSGIEVPTPPEREGVDLVALDAAARRLQAEDPLSARIVEMRFFAGMEMEDIASVLEISERTVRRHWVYAKAWLARELAQHAPAQEKGP